MMKTRETLAVPLVVTPDQRQARREARPELVRQVALGATVAEARRRCPVPMHRSTVYRLLKRVEREGEQALAERRHGHPTQLRGEVLIWMLDYCQSHIFAASREVQRLVAERSGVTVSVSQLNRVRAAHGQVIREVAPARITLSREDYPDAPLCLQVALIRDLRRFVPVQPDPEEAEVPPRWDSDLPLDERTWWREGWQATSAPAKETTVKLIPIVTTEKTKTIDAVELAQTYIHRWPAQENVIKDYLRPLGLDTNHGFAKVAVKNSEVDKRRTHLEQRLARLKQWAQSAGKREAQASRRWERLRKTFTSRSKELYQELWAYQRSLEEQEVVDHVLRREVKERKAVADAELEQLRIKEWRAYEQCNAEFRKQERYCKEQREVLRALADMKAQEKIMYELDHRKDQVMTVCKVALANLAMWVRDHYFPPSYAQATWRRLLPFFQLPGTITQDATLVQVELRPFNDRALNRDLAVLCDRVNRASPRLPDGRQLSFIICSSCCTLVAQRVGKIP